MADTSCFPLSDRWWRVLLIFIAAVALGIRLVGFTELGLQHQDETIYSIGAYRALGAGAAECVRANVYDNHFAPPLFYMLVEASYTLLAPGAHAAILVSLLGGTLAVPLVALLTAWIFDRGTGLLAGLLLGVCEYHILYCRMALTDALVTTLILAALLAMLHYVHSGRRLSLFAGGTAAAFACLTKYSGFVLPALLLAAWAGERLATPPPQGGEKPPAVARLWTAWLVCLGAAVLAALPLLGMICAAPGLDAWLAYRAHHTAWQAPFASLLAGAREYGAALLLWVPVPLLLLAGLGVYRAVRQRRVLAPGLVAVLLAYLASTLTYHKYPRLLLPLVPLLLVFAAHGTAVLWSHAGSWQRVVRTALAAVLVAACAAPLARALRTGPNGHEAAVAWLCETGGATVLPVRVLDPLACFFYGWTATPEPVEIKRRDAEEIAAEVCEGIAVLLVVEAGGGAGPLRPEALPDALARLPRREAAAFAHAINEVQEANLRGVWPVLERRWASGAGARETPARRVRLLLLTPPRRNRPAEAQRDAQKALTKTAPAE